MALFSCSSFDANSNTMIILQGFMGNILWQPELLQHLYIDHAPHSLLYNTQDVGRPAGQGSKDHNTHAAVMASESVKETSWIKDVALASLKERPNEGTYTHSLRGA